MAEKIKFAVATNYNEKDISNPKMQADIMLLFVKLKALQPVYKSGLKCIQIIHHLLWQCIQFLHALLLLHVINLRLLRLITEKIHPNRNARYTCAHYMSTDACTADCQIFTIY